ncbi:hypothetical protein GIB67_038690 [Kingdonia uniflora]|uniref:Uncharacterized protein n=1 Tax=Kingdonia uniflora TaxID=39325 RepID=A0A7J7NSH6_9MAGN|nr:hypothetical protein GIB67_038690 [Kingdonia uniflora]
MMLQSPTKFLIAIATIVVFIASLVIRIFQVVHRTGKPFRNMATQPFSTLIVLGSVFKGVSDGRVKEVKLAFRPLLHDKEECRRVSVLPPKS